VANIKAESPLISELGKKPLKKSKRVVSGLDAGMREYEPPSHDEMLVDRAHAAHRDVVESWVKGEVGEEKVKKSRERLHKVMKSHKAAQR